MALKKSVLAPALLAIGITIAIGLNQWRSQPIDPTLAFVQYAGRNLPAGVSVIAYRERIEDNFFHVRRYWLLSGNPTNLRQLVNEPGFVSSLEDARFALPDMLELFGKHWQSSDIVAGFEQDQSRGRWVWVFSGEREALYALN